MKNQILTDEDLNKIFANVEDVKVMLWHIHSLADLLVLKYQEMVDAGKISERDEYSTPILSIGEMLIEKAEESLKNIEELDKVGMKILNSNVAAII